MSRYSPEIVKKNTDLNKGQVGKKIPLIPSIHLYIFFLPSQQILCSFFYHSSKLSSEFHPADSTSGLQQDFYNSLPPYNDCLDSCKYGRFTHIFGTYTEPRVFLSVNKMPKGWILSRYPTCSSVFLSLIKHEKLYGSQVEDQQDMLTPCIVSWIIPNLFFFYFSPSTIS